MGNTGTEGFPGIRHRPPHRQQEHSQVLWGPLLALPLAALLSTYAATNQPRY